MNVYSKPMEQHLPTVTDGRKQPKQPGEVALHKICFYTGCSEAYLCIYIHIEAQVTSICEGQPSKTRPKFQSKQLGPHLGSRYSPSSPSSLWSQLPCREKRMELVSLEHISWSTSGMTSLKRATPKGVGKLKCKRKFREMQSLGHQLQNKHTLFSPPEKPTLLGRSSHLVS